MKKGIDIIEFKDVSGIRNGALPQFMWRQPQETHIAFRRRKDYLVFRSDREEIQFLDFGDGRSLCIVGAPGMEYN